MSRRSEMAEGLLRQTPAAMATQLSMWDSMSLRKLVISKARGVIQDGDHLRAEIDEQSVALQARFSGARMRVEILRRLAGHLEITLPTKMTPLDLDNLGERITRAAIALLQKTDKKFKGSQTQDMAAHILKKIFDELSDRFEKEDAETQERIVDTVMEGIQQMPEDQQERLRNELNVDELTDEAIRSALIAGSLGTGFAILIEAAGFSAYLIAVKILAGAAAIIGITLPFAVYTALTSLVALLANPLVLVVLLASVGRLINKRTTNKIRDGLTPIFVTQAIVSSALGPVVPEEMREFLQAYEEAMRLDS